VPNAIRDLALLVTEFHDLVHTVERQSAETLVALFDRIDAWRKPQRVEQIALTSEADARGRTGFESNAYPQGDYLRQAFEVVLSVSTREVVAAGFKGMEVREELNRRRIAALEQWKQQQD
jgi:tRNA nucleotidyltransferase (CCA-adding enzyme)